MCGWRSHIEKTEFPSSHHREEGWRRHQGNGAKPPYGRRRGGVPCPIDRNTTPPRGDARRGIRHFENSPLLGQQCLTRRGLCSLFGCDLAALCLGVSRVSGSLLITALSM